MGTNQHPIEWQQILEGARLYPIEAFEFVREGLSYSAQLVHGDMESLPELDRHITGQQLCLGLREYAIRQYGLLAPIVLEHWNVRRTDDFGRIVFAMIDAGLMSRTSDDDIDDFRAVFDFDEGFSRSEILAHLTARERGVGRSDLVP